MEKEFSRRALSVSKTLRSTDTFFVVVTAPSPDALKEADHFVSELKRLGITLRMIVANRMPPRFGTTTSSIEQLAASASSGDIALAHSLLAELCIDADRAEAGIDGFLARAQQTFAEVPSCVSTEMPSDIHDMESIAVLAQQLAAPQPRQ
jgi:anion-transporting  ArsA/GET3 family ATPase